MKSSMEWLEQNIIYEMKCNWWKIYVTVVDGFEQWTWTWTWTRSTFNWKLCMTVHHTNIYMYVSSYIHRLKRFINIDVPFELELCFASIEHKMKKKKKYSRAAVLLFLSLFFFLIFALLFIKVRICVWISVYNNIWL